MPLDDNEERAPRDNWKLADTLDTLRQTSEGDQPPSARDGPHQGQPSHHLSELRGAAAAMRSDKVVNAVSIPCTSAGVLAVLKILTNYFE